ncbi:MAG: molybdate ABC transporter substrate-binding protein [Leptolyngbyaceae cyanobacterium MAG.088]|nr:molybdate ABC transporter substrate-binding protein [Leptolyngbyaceae cyanobacterium MAG.088]
MQDVLEQLRTAYRTIDSTIDITYNFGSSGSLAQQIIQGAPVDIFLSASPQWINTLVDQGQLLSHSRRSLVQNSMVLVVPKDDQTITDFQDLSMAQKIAIGEPESVPAGHYAREVLTSMALFDQLQPSLVFGKNVRHVLAYVETGNVDAGLVYGTDALISEQVRIVATAPVTSHGAIVYAGAVVKGTTQSAAAEAMMSFLGSQLAAAIFQDHGFAPLE